MKFLSTALTATLGINLSHNRQPRAGTREIGFESTDRRYAQLTEMMTTYNPLFDERKFWTYGCNCLLLGDRPMSDPGHGKPVDELDTVCKAYKDCVKCAKMTHGANCIGEFVTYDYSYDNDQAQCNDDADTCGRALCECDLMLAQRHVGAIGTGL